MALELRPNCEYCDKDLPPGRRRRASAATSAPSAPTASRTSCMTSAPTAAAASRRGRSGPRRSGVRASRSRRARPRRKRVHLSYSPRGRRRALGPHPGRPAGRALAGGGPVVSRGGSAGARLRRLRNPRGLALGGRAGVSRQRGSGRSARAGRRLARALPADPRARSTRRPAGGDFDELHRATLDDLLAERGVELPPSSAGASCSAVAPTGPVARRPGGPRGAAAPACRRDALQRPRGPARRPRAPWRPAFDCVLSAELARRLQAGARGLPGRGAPARRGARRAHAGGGPPVGPRRAPRAGLRTAFVDRPQEYGPGRRRVRIRTADVSVGDLGELAERLT